MVVSSSHESVTTLGPENRDKKVKSITTWPAVIKRSRKVKKSRKSKKAKKSRKSRRVRRGRRGGLLPPAVMNALPAVALGVAANKKIRSMLTELCSEENYQGIFPPIELCGDNAAMIAMVGLEKFKLKRFNELDYPAKPRWPLDEDALFLKGAGVTL